MSLKAIDLNEVKDFVMPGDKDNPTVFKIGALDTSIRSKIEDEATSFSVSPGANSSGEASTQLKIAHKNLQLVRFGLKGFKNFLDAKSKPIQFKTETYNLLGRSYEVIASSLLDIIPMNVISRLAAEIKKENTLTEKEIKNSD